MLNNVSLMGRITKELELKQTQSGVSYLTLTLAVERSYAKNKEERETDFIDITTWRRTAEFAAKYFSKGQLIAVQGYIQTGTYQDKDGNKRKSVNVVAENVFFAGKNNETGTRKTTIKEANNEEELIDIEYDSDLPF